MIEGKPTYCRIWRIKFKKSRVTMMKRALKASMTVRRAIQVSIVERPGTLLIQLHTRKKV